MANYQSVPAQYANYVDPIDNDRLEKTLKLKDAKYKQNMMQVAGAIQSVASIDLLRDQDKMHLYNNLKNVLQTVDDSDNIDFSNGLVGSELQMYISSAIDKDVLKNAGIAQKYKGFQTQMQEKQAKGDGSFSQINYQDAMIQSGFEGYMQGENDNVNSFNYTDYIDVDSKMFKRAKEIKDLYPKSPVKIPDPNNPGRMINREVSQLSQPEWQAFLQMGMSEQDRAQLAINGRVRYDYNDMAAQMDVQPQRQEIEKSYDSAIQTAQSKLSGADDATKQKVNEAVEQLQGQRKAALTKFDGNSQTAGQIGGRLLEEQLITGLASTMARDTFLGYTKDDAYFAQGKAEKLLDPNDPFTMDANLDGIQDYNVTTRPTQTPEGLGNIVDNYDTQYKNEKDGFSSMTSEIYNSLPDNETTQALKTEVRENYKRENGKEPTELQLQREVVLKSVDALPLKQRKDYLASQDRVAAFQEQIGSAQKEASNRMFLQGAGTMYEEFVSDTFGEKDIIMFDGGKQTTFSSYLAKQGIDSQEKFNRFLASDSQASKKFKGNFQLQSLDMEDFRTINPYYRQGGGPRRGGLSIGSKIGLDKSSIRNLRESFSNMETGEKFDDVFQVNGSDLTIKKQAEESSFVSIMDKTLKEDISGRGPFGSDRTVQNEGSLKSILSGDKYKDAYEQALGLQSIKNPGMNTITVQGKNGTKTVPLRQEIIQFMSVNGTPELFDDKLPLSITKDPASGDILAYQNREDKSKGDNGYLWGSRVVSARISATDLSGMTELNKVVNMNEERGKIDYLQNIQSKVPKISYPETTMRFASDLNDSFPGNSAIRNLADKKSVLDHLTNNHVRLAQSNIYPEYAATVKEVLRNSNRFSLEMDSYNGRGSVKVMMKSKNGQKVEIDNVDVTGRFSEGQFTDLYYGVPQVFLSLALDRAAAEYETTKQSGIMDIIKQNL